MTVRFGIFPSIVFTVVTICWFIFAAILLRRKKLERTADAKRDRASDAGLILQLISYLVLLVVREPFTPIGPNNQTLDWLFGVLTIILSVGSVWLISTAIGTLGKEWSVKARLIEGHRLATTGPYRFCAAPHLYRNARNVIGHGSCNQPLAGHYSRDRDLHDWNDDQNQE